MPCPDDDVDGTPMSVEARAERIKALKLCLEHKRAIKEARGIEALKAAYLGVEDVLRAFDAAAHGRLPSHVRENFLRLKFSGLLQTCIDHALKVVEERRPHLWVIVNYAQDVLKAEMLQSAEEVSKENLHHCKDFTKAHMPNDEFDAVDDSVYKRLKWFLEVNRKTKAYLSRFTIETLKIEIQEKLESLEVHTSYSAWEGARELWTFLKKNWRKDPKDDDE